MRRRSFRPSRETAGRIFRIALLVFGVCALVVGVLNLIGGLQDRQRASRYDAAPICQRAALNEMTNCRLEVPVVVRRTEWYGGARSSVIGWYYQFRLPSGKLDYINTDYTDHHLEVGDRAMAEYWQGAAVLLRNKQPAFVAKSGANPDVSYQHHLNYSAVFFGLSAVAFVVFGLVVWRRRRFEKSAAVWRYRSPGARGRVR